MGKKIQGNMSDAEERILMALYIPVMYMMCAKGYMPFVRGRGVAELMGGAWSSYRHKVMVRLAAMSWVKMEKVTVGSVTQWVYTFTDSGYNAMGERVKSSLKNHIGNSETFF